MLFDVLDHSGDETGIDDGLDGRTISDGKYFSDPNHSVVLSDDILVGEGGNEIWKNIHGIGLFEETV